MAETNVTPKPEPKDRVQPAKEDEWITCAQAATMLGVSKSTVSRWAKKGKLDDNGQKGRKRKVSKTSVLIEKEPPKKKSVEDSGKPKKKPRKRSTQKQMQTRNEAVAMIAAKFHVEHERLPTVDDIMNKCEYTRQQIYSTDSYKEGKIAKNSAKPTDEMTGKSVTTTELFSNNSLEHTRADRKSKADQALVDGLIEEQQGDDASRFVK